MRATCSRPDEGSAKYRMHQQTRLKRACRERDNVTEDIQGACVNKGRVCVSVCEQLSNGMGAWTMMREDISGYIVESSIEVYSMEDAGSMPRCKYLKSVRSSQSNE